MLPKHRLPYHRLSLTICSVRTLLNRIFAFVTLFNSETSISDTKLGYCGNILGPPAMLYADGNCSMACTGNSSEACGAGNFLSIYYANKPAPAGPQVNPGPPGWKSYGCWLDGNPRTLANGVNVPGGGANMSIALCTAACGSAGYTLAGSEYAGECYCDNNIAAGATNTTLTDCNMPW